MTIEFTVPGTPVGKGRPRFARRGNFVSTYTPAPTASYENLVKMQAALAMLDRPLILGPVQVQIHLYVTPPASWSQKKQGEAIKGTVYPTSKPDIDNTLKCLADACNTIVWKDDKQIVDLHVWKRYADTARAVVRVLEL